MCVDKLLVITWLLVCVHITSRCASQRRTKTLGEPDEHMVGLVFLVGVTMGLCSRSLSLSVPHNHLSIRLKE